MPRDAHGEPIVNEKINYTFNTIPTSEDFTKIDTSAYYVQVFEGRFYNENEKKYQTSLQFHSDGFFKRMFVNPDFTAKQRTKKEVHYGGKYRVINDIIELEVFYPSQGGETNYYSRDIRKGRLVGDRIIFDDGFSLLSVFEKSYHVFR